MSSKSMSFEFSASSDRPRMPLILGLVGATLGTLFTVAHWSFGALGGVAVLALSAAESEPFLLFLIFTLPIGWFSMLGSAAVPFSRFDVATAVHFLATVGFFSGRLWRGRLASLDVWRCSISRASVLFTAAVLLSLVFGTTGWTRDSLRSLIFFGSYIGFYFVILVWVDSRRRLSRVCMALLLSTIMVSLFAILQEAAGGYTSLWLFLNPSVETIPPWNARATSFLNYPNSLAGYLNLALPFAVACCVIGPSRWKKVGAWTVGLGFVALLLTQSLGGLAAFVSVVVLAILCLAKNRRSKLSVMAGVCALGCLLYPLRNMLNPTHSVGVLGPDMVIRLLLWNTAWGYFVHSPLLGVGWGNFIGLYGLDLSAFSDWIPPGVLAVHNIYLQLLTETGLVGFVVFFYLIIQSWRQARRHFLSSADFISRALAFGVLGALLSVLVHGFVDFLFQVSPQFGSLFWVLLALLVASARLQRKFTLDEEGATGTCP